MITGVSRAEDNRHSQPLLMEIETVKILLEGILVKKKKKKLSKF